MSNINLKIDEKRTKKAVERSLYKYREYLITLPSQLTPRITANYSIVPPSNTNEFFSKTETVAIERVMYEQERTSYMTMIHQAVETLKPDEKKIIIESYLMEEPLPDVEIWVSMTIGKTKYYQCKTKALLRLAFALKQEVYHNKRVG